MGRTKKPSSSYLCSGDATGGRIDGIARFIDTNRVVVGNCTVNGHCQPDGEKRLRVRHDCAYGLHQRTGVAVHRGARRQATL